MGKSMRSSEIGRVDGPARLDVKSEVALTLIDAMERGETPWQKPWNANALRPVNPTSGNEYRGVNRLLLALSGRSDPRWMTYLQAKAQKWQVRRGERGTSIVKLVQLSQAEAVEAGAAISDAEARDADRKAAFALRRYTVFNAQQIEGVPELDVDAAREFDPLERAENVIAALKQTGLVVVHGGSQAFYSPALDEVRLPPKTSFHSLYDYYATAMHKGGHSTLHAKRLDRKEALGKKWGDEAYAMEELRAEICSAILASETGVPMTQAHIENHGAYLRHWLRVVEADPMAIFSAAKDAEQMAQYMLGLEKQMLAMEAHNEWIRDYDQAWER
jgi:antirestriction protein ArdC